MKLSDQQVKEISEELLCGNLCYVHNQSGELECFPDPNSPYVDVELFQEVVDKVDNDFSNYIEIEKMPSHQSFQVMEDFAENCLIESSKVGC
ncbi:MAG: hypothetical protein R8G66_29365 [Cytophagales bacterium]|nr:hypothetical protein [Cytophagales bacterium]